MQKLFEIFKVGEGEYLLKQPDGSEVALSGRCTTETDYLSPDFSLKLEGRREGNE